MRIFKKLIIITCFVIVFCLALSGVSYVVTPKNMNYYKFNHLLYDDDMEVVNVGFFGGSHAYNAFCPAAMYYSEGIKAYSFCSSGQPFPLTYHLMKEVVKTQKLEVAVVDLYYLGMTTEYFTMSNYMRSVFDNMKLSIGKIEAINNCVAPNERASFYFKLMKYHSRWSEITKDDIFPKEDKLIDYSMLGWGYNSGHYGKDITPMEKTDVRGEIPQKQLNYLNEVIKLCDENNIKLIFTSLPHDYAVTYHPDKWVDNEQEMFNTVSDIAKQNDIPFLQFNDLLDEMGFDFSQDMYNSSHTQLSGSLKISKYIAKFIKENYELSDLSGIQAELWQEYYNKYKQRFEK